MNLKIFLLASFFVLSLHALSAQSIPPSAKTGKKGDLYFYWGWNRGFYTDSDISFSGESYDFTLEKVIAKDKPTQFSVDNYFNPVKFTIPQYNFRIGYFVGEHWDISFGIDHMKYVMQSNQVVKINGFIGDSGTSYDGYYSDEELLIADNFLSFEHTDGLNYANIELRRFDQIIDLHAVKINLTEGAGIGILVPRTNAMFLSQKRHDEMHLAGYGTSIMMGLNVSFFEKFFIQTELKGGYINMPDIRTTKYTADKASQSFFYGQFNFVIGGTFHIGAESKANS